MIAEVILPVPVPVYYSYIVPENLQNDIQAGSRAIVPLGKSKIHTGIIRHLHHDGNYSSKLKPIIAVPDQTPVFSEEIMTLWEWMAFYYHCTVGEVYKAAVPSYYRNFDDIWVKIHNPERLPEGAGFLGDQLNVNFEFQLKHSIQSFDAKTVGKALIALSEISNLSAEYRSALQPREKYIVRKASLEAIEHLLSESGRAPARKKILKYFTVNKKLRDKEIKTKLAVGNTALKPLLDDNILSIEERLSEQAEKEPDFSGLPELSPAQQKAKTEIKNGFNQKKVCLLYGVTSSGKTHIYLHLIKEALQEGKQVLYLLPEIALTTQIIDRINKSTGGIAEVYHSKFVGKSRLRLWENVQNRTSQLIIGARSAVFLPLKNPGLIIVDEEHDQSFKQHEPAPRYHARDMAVVLGHKFGANVLLGSATPSAESWLNASKGKYHLIKLTERFQNFPLPDIRLLDTWHARKRKVMTGDFHPETLKQIREVLDRKGQVIILRNRKGYAPLIRCTDCGWTASCPNCSVNLTYHKKDGKLKCHHCHYSIEMPRKCPDCGSTDLNYFGYGTQKVEEDLHYEFPDAGISRFDQDSLQNPHQYRKIIDEFSAQKTHILVGTQMLTKGLDFKNVRLIVVLHADQMLNYPDFRAFERGYQMLEQVSGRTGRHMEDALVLIQTSFPDHPVLNAVKFHQYEPMITNELHERQSLGYPPFVHLINIHLKSNNPWDLDKKTALLFRDLHREFGQIVMEPAVPVIEKKGKQYERFIQVKLPKGNKQYQYKRMLQKIVQGFSNSSVGRSIRIYPDADPV